MDMQLLRRAAPAAESRAVRERVPDFILPVYVPSVALLFAFQGLFADSAWLLYALAGAAAVAVSALCVWRGRLLRTADSLLLLFFPLFTWVSAVLNCGLSTAFFFSWFFIVWAVLLSLYFALRITSTPERLMSLYAGASVLGLSLVCLFVLLTATASLFPMIPGQNTVRGCFQLGRLCGLSNANIFAFSCTALCLLSMYLFLRSAGRRRLIWVLSGFAGWFCLGLTNCRTGIIGVGFALGVLVFSVLAAKQGRFRVLRAAVIAAAAAVVCMQSLYLPPVLYRGVLSCYGSLTRSTNLLHNLNALRVRRIIDDDGTVLDRVMIWKRVLAALGKTPLRTWLGVSSLYSDGVGGVYEGHHEISILHAHNSYLEILQRFGVLGLALLLASALRWGAAGLRCLTSSGETSAARCLAACAAAVALMGLAEQPPFPCSPVCSLSLPFFAICGYLMNDRRPSP